MPKKLKSSLLTWYENSTKIHKARYPNPENLAPVNIGVNFELGERGSEIPPTSYTTSKHLMVFDHLPKL